MTTILPGATIGVLGGGQLGRMLAFEAHRLGYRVGVLDPDPDGPAAQVADFAIAAPLTDAEAALRLAERCDVVTLETEHVPAHVLVEVERAALLRPGSRVLAVVQDRLQQRRFLAALGAPQVAYHPVDDLRELGDAARAIGGPSVLKTRTSGYDGRGQARLKGPEGAEAAYHAIGGAPAVLEAYVALEREISVVLSRSVDGSHRFYPVAENLHRAHVLHTTRVPARVSAQLASLAGEIAAAIADALSYVGVMAVEFFETRDGRLLVNEIAPRTHNSGHYTFGGCATSQFEQHVRSICGLPPGDTALLEPCVMLNLLGDLWSGGAPAWDAVLSTPGARLHLYGKRVAAPGRKMGHVLVTAEDAEQAAALAAQIERRITDPTNPVEEAERWS